MTLPVRQTVLRFARCNFQFNLNAGHICTEQPRTVRCKSNLPQSRQYNAGPSGVNHKQSRKTHKCVEKLPGISITKTIDFYCYNQGKA